jgi:mevalonate kinase
METLNSKVLLFGEYSLLYNSMALTIPYDRFSGKFNFCKEGLVDPTIHSSNLSLTNFCNHILENHMDENFALNVKKFKAELEVVCFSKVTFHKVLDLEVQVLLWRRFSCVIWTKRTNSKPK